VFEGREFINWVELNRLYKKTKQQKKINKKYFRVRIRKHFYRELW
jgi:hypothetical protein